MFFNCCVGEDCWESFTARRSNQSILKEISPEYSLEGLMLNLKPQYFGHLIWRTDSFEKTLMLGKIEDRRKRGRQDEMVGWHHRLDGHKLEQVLGVGDGQGSLACYSPWGLKSQPLLSSWTVSSVGKESPYSIGFDSWDWKSCWRKDRLPTPVYLGFPCGSAGEESAWFGRPGFDPWVGKIPCRRKKLPT